MQILLYYQKPYSYGEITDEYEYCGIDFVLLKDGENPLSKISESAGNFVDAEEYIDVPEDFKVIAVSETTRDKLESCIELAGSIPGVIHP